MRVAGAIILGVIGAILYFAVTVDVAGISLSMVGVIMMVAAAIWFVIELIQGAVGTQTKQSETVQRSDGSVEHHERKTQTHNDDI